MSFRFMRQHGMKSWILFFAIAAVVAWGGMARKAHHGRIEIGYSNPDTFGQGSGPGEILQVVGANEWCL